MQTRLILLLLPLVIFGCNKHNTTDAYFNYKIKEVSIPDTIMELYPTVVLDDLSHFFDFWIDDEILWGQLSNSAGDILLAADINSGKEIGRFGKKGRGPKEFLSPVSFDLNEGHMLIYDVMNTRVSDLNLKSSIDRGITDVSNVFPLNPGRNEFLTLSSIHRIDNSLLALDTGANPTSSDLYQTPDYVLYDLSNGKRTKEFNVFKSIPLKSTKKELKHIEVKSRLYLTDCSLPNEMGICFVMKYIPQVNFLNPQSGKITGYRITELSGKSLIPNYLHYNSVCAYGDKVYAIYVGADIDLANDAQVKSEIHVFNLNGEFQQRLALDGTYVDVRASDEGLFLSKLQENKTKVLCELEWFNFLN